MPVFEPAFPGGASSTERRHRLCSPQAGFGRVFAPLTPPLLPGANPIRKILPAYSEKLV